MTSRLYLHVPLKEGLQLTLNKEDSHYLTRVLRLPKESIIEVFNGEDSAYEAVLAGEEKQAIQLVIKQKKPDVQAITRQSLAVAVCAPQKMTWILQKATELGVRDIWILETAFSQNSPGNISQLADKKERYEKIIISACQQSGVNHIPVLHGCTKLAPWLQQGWSDFSLILADPSGQKISNVPVPEKPVIWLVGPEGGWSNDELIACQKLAQAVSIAPSILRMETACVAALALGHSWLP